MTGRGKGLGFPLSCCMDTTPRPEPQASSYQPQTTPGHRAYCLSQGREGLQEAAIKVDLGAGVGGYISDPSEQKLG